jgi:TonB family protein
VKSKPPEIASVLTAVMMAQGHAETVPLSQITAGKLVHRVDPVLPPSAQAKDPGGTVVLSATIGKNGNVREVRLISGPETLGTAATEAIHQWLYEPFQVAGQPVEAQTTITITFPPR